MSLNTFSVEEAARISAPSDGAIPVLPGAAADADYRRMAQLMYAVRRCCPRAAVLAVSTLHPRHPIPPDHVEVQALWHAPGRAMRSVPAPAGLLGRWLRTVLFAARDAVMLASLRLRYGRRLRRALRAPAALLIKSWRFHERPLGSDGDFYFGLLQPQLHARGLSALTLYGDVRGPLRASFADSVLKDGAMRGVPELLLVPAWAPLAAVVKQAGAAILLWRMARRAKHHRLRALCAVACRESVEPITMRNLLQYAAARAAVRRLKPRAYLSLYEGQPWEPLAWAGVKAADGQCLIAGYQHTVVMPHSREVTSPHWGSWKPAAPEVVLALGSATRAMMASGHARGGTRFVTVGRLREPSRRAHRTAPQPQRRALLVLPLGVIEESARLFQAALHIAAQLDDHRILLRCHPLLPFEQVQSRVDPALLRLPNVEISRQADFRQDCARTSAVLYQASSAVLYAVPEGLKPFYLLPPEGYPTVDPLVALPGWREAVVSPQHLAEALRRYARSDAGELRPAWERATAYVEEYTRPADAAEMACVIEALQLA